MTLSVRAFSAWSILTVGAASAVNALDETNSPEGDSDRVIVSTTRPVLTRSQEATTQIGADTLAIYRAQTLADAIALAPSANITTNSRGETLVYFRNVGERQTALLFDGALINLPWDNRIDIALVPTLGLDSVNVADGITTVLDGPNTAGGVIDLRPADALIGWQSELAGELGSGGLRSASAALRTGNDHWGGNLALGYSDRDGVPVSRDADLAFSQTRDDLRTNTDRQQTNLLGRVRFSPVDTIIFGASALYFEAGYGVAPEGHIDPETGPVRYWRYPDTKNLTLVSSVDTALTGNRELSASLWVQDAEQSIENYTSDDYTVIDEVERGDDRTYGVRLGGAQVWGPNTVRAALTLFDSRHREQSFMFDNAMAVRDLANDNEFRQRSLSLGVDFESSWRDVSWRIGVGGDTQSALETGGRPDAGDFSAVNLIAAIDKPISSQWSFTARAGQKSRLPTLRELYGEALGRFVINPDLKPEISRSFETSLIFQSPQLQVTATPFLRATSDEIDRVNVRVDGRTVRQRVNREGTRAIGLEIVGNAQLNSSLSLFGAVTAMRLDRIEPEPVENGDQVAERPAITARLGARYDHPSGLSAMVEGRHRGRAYSLAEDNSLAPLAASTTLDIQLAYAPNLQVAAPESEFFIRVENVTDALVEPQLGLPAPGRAFTGGVRLAF